MPAPSTPSRQLPPLQLPQRLALSLACLVLATSYAAARTRDTPPPQPALPAPSVQPIHSPPATPATLWEMQAEPPAIEAAPLQSPSITAAPTTQASLVPTDAPRRQIQQKLQQLQRTANPASGYGSTRAAAQAAWQLGLIYLHGAGVPIDRLLAQQWFERAARQNLESWAWAGLAWCAMDGCSAPPQPALATDAIARLRRTHPARADYLTWLQLSQRQPLQITAPGPERSASPPPGMPWLERAAAAGDTQANIALGLMAFAQQDLQQAQAYFRRVADQSMVAAHNLKVVQAQLHKDAAPALRATDGMAQTALDMARMYHQGQGVPANFAEAVRFYRLAEQRGSTEAHKMLELIFSRPMPDGSLDVAWMQQLAHADPSTPGLKLESGVHALQLERPPTPLFDLLPAYWQQQVKAISL